MQSLQNLAISNFKIFESNVKVEIELISCILNWLDDALVQLILVSRFDFLLVLPRRNALNLDIDFSVNSFMLKFLDLIN
jgi:hypothetical protein